MGDLHAAMRRAGHYLDALDHERATLANAKPFYVDGRIDERHGADGNTHVLYSGDLHALLAAADGAQAATARIIACADEAALRQQIAAGLERSAALYDQPAIWPEDSTHPDSLGAHAMRHAYRAAARMVREDTLPAATQPFGIRIGPDGPIITGSPQPAATPRHQPLTDEPCGHVPTPRGIDYLAARRQQHPRGAEQ